jgi:hypothetical protein
MTEEPKNTYQYRVLRYTPNLVRDEWVNIGVLLETVAEKGRSVGTRRAIRVVEEPSEMARVKRLHPNADETLLRALTLEFEARLAETGAAAAYLEKLGETLSNVLQFSPRRALLADDFDAELDRLYRTHVAPPPRVRAGIVESTRWWIKDRINDVFRRRRVPKLERNIPAVPFTEPGDPLKLDYGYQNGVRGFLHAVAIGRDPAQPKILAYTARRVRAQLPDCEFTAITESEPAAGNPRTSSLRVSLRTRISPSFPCRALKSSPKSCAFGCSRFFAAGGPYPDESRPHCSGKERRPSRISAAHAPK